MMPTRADIEAAVPKCPGTSTQVRMGGIPGMGGTAMKHIPCGAPMVWEHEPERWTCRKDKGVLTGVDAAALVDEEQEAAA